MSCLPEVRTLFRGAARKESLPPGALRFWFLFQGNLESLGNRRGRYGLDVIIAQQFLHGIERQAGLLPGGLLLLSGLFLHLTVLEALLGCV